MPIQFNKIHSKWFYESHLSFERVLVSIQGQQTLHLKNDILQHLLQLVSFNDISQSVDPTRTFLPYLNGMDKMRHKVHGQFLF